MNELTLSLLGTFRAEIAGKPMAFRTDKVRALLLYLAIEPGPHRRESLATLLWSEFPDHEARQNLTASLSRLRKSLDSLLVEEPTLLEVDRQIVHLNLSRLDHRIDVLRFESMLASSLTHPHQTLLRCTTCIQRLEEAVACYGGTFLAGFTLPDSPVFTEWQLLRQENYLEQVLEALYTLTEHAVLQEELNRGEGFARKQLALVPWREEAHRQLIRILLQRGQRSAALAQYERCCASLAEALAVAPEAETTTLYQRIKQGESSLLSHNLPALTTPLIGQESTLGQITTRLQTPSCRLLTLVGLGGMGKSRLALAAAEQLVGHFKDGVYLVLLAGMEGEVGQLPALLHRAVFETLQAVGVLPRTIDITSEKTLRDALRHRHMLLILDNFETLLGAASLLTEWLNEAPGLHMLVTSREPLSRRAETVIHVPPLTMPPAFIPQSEKEVRDLERYSAVQLFVLNVQRVCASFHLNSSNGEAVVRICQMLGGLPLALELAAAWSPLQSAPQIAEHLTANLALLSTTSPDVPKRQRSIHVVFEQSWQWLTPVEQQTLAALSVFVGSFSLRAAEAVLNETVAGFWFDTLLALLDKMLMYRVEERLEVHPLVRQYAAEKLVTSGRQSRVQASHSTYCATLVQGHIPQGKEAREHARIIEAELDNIRAAWNWAVEHQEITLLQQFRGALFYFYEHKGWYQEGATVFGLVLQRLFGEDESAGFRWDAEVQALRAWVLIYQGQCTLQCRPEHARILLERGLALATHLEEHSAMALALHGLGLLITLTSIIEGTEYLSQALALYRTLQEEMGITRCLVALGHNALHQGNYLLARQLREENLLLCRRNDNSGGIIGELFNLAWVDRALGNYESAYRYGQEALKLAMTSGYSLAVGYTLISLIDLGGIVEGYETAQAYFAELRACPSYVGNEVLMASAYLNLGDVALVHGLYPQAEADLQQALALYQQTNNLKGVAHTLPLLGEAALKSGKLEAARHQYREAVQLAHETGTLFNLLKALLGWTWVQVEEVEEGMELQVIELLAFVLHQPATWHEDQETARRLLGKVTSGMDPDIVALAQARGRALTKEEAMAIAGIRNFDDCQHGWGGMPG